MGSRTGGLLGEMVALPAHPVEPVVTEGLAVALDAALEANLVRRLDPEPQRLPVRRVPVAGGDALDDEQIHGARYDVQFGVRTDVPVVAAVAALSTVREPLQYVVAEQTESALGSGPAVVQVVHVDDVGVQVAGLGPRLQVSGDSRLAGSGGTVDADQSSPAQLRRA